MMEEEWRGGGGGKKNEAKRHVLYQVNKLPIYW